MKLYRAIECLELMLEAYIDQWDDEDIASCKLGIEAGKRVEEARVKGAIFDYRLLPGETQD